MQKIRSLIVITMLLLPCAAFPEYIFLKNGAIIKGRIENETTASFKLRLQNGKSRLIYRSRVMRILYTDLYMGRVYIRLTNGEIIEAYQVDEDQKSITYRKTLYKPEEFTIARSKILFTARKNPNELKCKADYEYADLSWKPPMGKIDKYRIYLRKKKESYPGKPVAETDNLDFRLSGLSSSTDYAVIVTAVDKTGYESLPSNEVELTTLNYAPSKPEFTDLPCIENGYAGKVDASLIFRPSSDPDGDISYYIIKIHSQGVKGPVRMIKISPRKLVIKDNKARWTLKGLSDKSEYHIIIAAIDNRGKNSEDTDAISFSTENREPEAPDIKTRVHIIEKKRFARASVKWEEAHDPDGYVTRYCIYRESGDRWEKVQETPKNSFIMDELPLNRRLHYQIRSIDNRGMESADDEGTFTISTYPSLIKTCIISFGPEYISPSGGFSNIFSNGYGASAGFLARPSLYPRLETGLIAGYWKMSPEKEDVEKGNITYLSLSGGWNFFIRRRISVTPFMNIGTAWISMRSLNGLSFEDEQSVEPVFSAGLRGYYSIAKGLMATITLQYGFIYEPGGEMPFFTSSIGLAYRL